MANRLGLSREYKIYYSQFSDIAHVGTFSKHIKFDGSSVILEPIRSPENVRTIVNLVMNLAFRIFQLIITKYFNRDLPSFRERYIRQWRDRFLSIPEIVVKTE